MQGDLEKVDNAQAIDVAYACNDGYYRQTYVSMVSLFESNQEAPSITVWFIDMGLSDNNLTSLKNLSAEYERSFKPISFSELADSAIFGETGRHIVSVYAKLFFTRLPESVHRIYYLDSDTVIVGSLQPLWKLDMADYSTAGVETLHSKEDNIAMGLPADARAINDGTALLNLDYWREHRLTEKCIEFIRLHNGKPPVLSEGTINNVCLNSMMILAPKFNYMTSLVNEKAVKLEGLTGRPYYSQDQLDEARDSPVVIHFVSGFSIRPWFSNSDHPLRSQYLKYRDMTPFSAEPLEKSKKSLRLIIISKLYERLPISTFVKLKKQFGR